MLDVIIFVSQIKGSVRNNICSYFVSLRQGGGVHPNFFVSLTDENEQMFDPDFFWFFVFNIKAREEQPLEKRFDETIFFLPQKKVTCDDSILKFPTG